MVYRVLIDSMLHGNTSNMNKKAKFYKADISDVNMMDIFEVEKADVVIHNAAQICVANFVNALLEDANINIRWSLNVLEAARKAEVKKIIYHVSQTYSAKKCLNVRYFYIWRLRAGKGFCLCQGCG